MPKFLAEGESQMNFRISAEKKEAFKKYAEEHNTSASKLILEFIDSCLGIVPTKEQTDLTEVRERLSRLENLVMGESAA